MAAVTVYVSMAAAQPYTYVPADRNQSVNIKGADGKILPASHLREYDPVTVFFDRDAVPGAPGPIEPAAQLITITPAHPGEFIKIDGRTLEFRPAEPWGPLKKYRITSGKNTRELTALLPLPKYVNPEPGSAGLDPVSRVEFGFAVKADAQALSRLVSIEACPLPGIDAKGCRLLKPAEYRVTESVRGPTESFRGWDGRGVGYIYGFALSEPIGYGQRIKVTLRLADRAEFKDAARVYSFETKPDFAMARAGTYEQLYMFGAGGISYDARQAVKLDFERKIVVEFTAPFADPGLTAVKNMVNITPPPSKFEYQIRENRLIVTLGADEEKLYKVTLNPAPLKDRAGRSLTNRKPGSFYAYLPKVEPFAQWERGFGIAERFGPQQYPVNTRGVSALDLKVHKVDPLHPAFANFPNGRVTVNETKRPPGPGEEPARLDSLYSRKKWWSEGSGHLAELEKHIMMLGSPHFSGVVDLDKEGTTQRRHTEKSIDLKPMLAAISGKDKPGSYLIGIRLLDGSDTRRHYARVDVTDLCLSFVEAKNRLLFGVTSYANGKVVPDASVRIEGVVDYKMTTLAQGKTGSDGMYALEITEELEKKYRGVDIQRIVVSKGDDVLVYDIRKLSSEAARYFADNHWHYGFRAWEGLFKRRPESKDRNVRGFVRTERPIYRPEDSVFIKGYVRETVHGTIGLPGGNPPRQAASRTAKGADTAASDKSLSYKLRVRAPSKNDAFYPVALNEFGSFDLKIVPPEPSTGEFELTLMDNSKNSKIASTDFLVEAYRIPRFEVRMGGNDRIPNDGPAEVRASASYYAGGRVVDQEISWKVTSYPYDHRPRGFAGYILSSDGRYGAVSETRRQSVSEENGRTDENGQARITLNPQAATSGNPARYIVEATVTDADRQTVSARHSVIALPPFILGVRADRHITSGSTISARVAAIGINDSLIANQKVTVELKRVLWTSYLADSDFSQGKPKYITDETAELIEERSISTKDSPVLLEFKDRQPGVYILELSSRDRLGRLQSVKVDLYLAGSGQQAWKKAEQSVFETVTDRNTYEPGQQAKILLKSPYKKALALAIVERPDGSLLNRWVDINDGQGSFTVDIRQEMAPKIPVSFLLMRPRAPAPRRAQDGMPVDAGKPETVGNTTWLTVNPVANMLDVKLTHAPVTTPDATIDITVSLRDNQGKPRAGEVALWLVDEAVLSLRKEKDLDPLEAFLEKINSRIKIRDSRNLALGNLFTVENPGGGGGDFDHDADALGKQTPRKNFKTVPYWNPSIKVDKSGNATVKVPIPSDLTNFAVRAMAVSGPDRFGAAKSRISVRLPVIVQPALPRFVRLGDRIRAGGIARVVEGPGGAATWSISSNGLTVKSEPDAANQQSAQNRQVQLDAAKPAPLLADLHVETPPFTSDGRLKWDSVSVKMAVMRSADRAGDAFEVKIPVLPDRQFIEETQFARIDKGESFTWKALSEPARANTVLSHLLVSDNQYLPKIISAMTALVRYPYGCTEQVVSQSYPSIVYNDLWDRYGIKSPDVSVYETVNRTMEFLKTSQHSDGLFGYWPGTPGYVYLTAYVVDFLTEVNDANKALKQPFAFDQAMYASATGALKRSLRSDYSRFVGGHSSYERTCALAALARSGHLDIGYARELAAAGRELDVQGMANVVKTIAENQDALGSEYAALEKQLWGTAVFTDRQGTEMFTGFRRPGAPLGARVHSNDVTALASLISAVSSIPSSSQDQNRTRTALLVDELIRMGADDGWGGIHANSLSLLALRSFIDNVELSSNNTFSFNDGDKSHQLTMNGALSKYWQNGKSGNLTCAGQPDRAFWVKLSRRYMPQAPGSAAEPEQRGFAVKRGLIKIHKNAANERIAIDKGGSTITFIAGDIAEEHIQVVNPETRQFVAVSIPIAAGLEPLNPRLENATSDARPANRSTNEGDYAAFFDDRVVYFFEKMGPGTYDFYFRTQAITEGEFSHPPAKAEMMYQMSVYGTSAGSRVVVK